MSKSNSAYWCWHSMKQRCSNEKNPRYKDWGGRGITFPDSWRTFAGFLKDMGPRPTLDHSIERRDNNKSYSKDNCKWATASEQCQNRRLLANKTGESFITKNMRGGSYRISINRDGQMKHSRSINNLNDAKELRDLILGELA